MNKTQPISVNFIAGLVVHGVQIPGSILQSCQTLTFTEICCGKYAHDLQQAMRTTANIKIKWQDEKITRNYQLLTN